MEPVEYQRGEYTISTDIKRLDIGCIHAFLSEQSYWAAGRPLEIVQKAIENSLNFGVFHDQQQIGFARIVTDYATFAWLCDVFIVPEYRKKGLGKWLVECVINHPDLIHIRRIMLATRDAHELYRQYGQFVSIDNPNRWMERMNPDA